LGAHPVSLTIQEQCDVRHYYNRQNAAKYVKDWYDKFNPKYRERDADCTNFISQALRAGGWRMVGGNDPEHDDYKNRDVWWYGKYQSWIFFSIGNRWFGHNSSESWVSASAFYRFLKSSNRARRVDDPASLDVGDVVQMATPDGKGGFDVHHTMMVTDVKGLMLGQHTTGQIMPYNVVKQKNKGKIFIFWKILDDPDPIDHLKGNFDENDVARCACYCVRSPSESPPQATETVTGTLLKS
jgi:hypothetical protein